MSYCFAILRAAQGQRNHQDVVQQSSLMAQCDVPNDLGNRHAALLQRSKTASLHVRLQRWVSCAVGIEDGSHLFTQAVLCAETSFHAQKAAQVLVSVGRLTVVGSQEADSARFALLPFAFAATPSGAVLSHCYSDLPDSFARSRFCRVASQFCR